MKKIFVLVATLLLLLSGCARDEAIPDSISGLEDGVVNTYLIGDYMPVDEVSQKLQNVGFDVVASYEGVKGGTTILFTDDMLIGEAAKKGRGFIALSRVFVDEKEKMISFTNPIYFGKAFMQEQYNHQVFSSVLEKINRAFPSLKPSTDEYPFDDLGDYQFMTGMPYYQDQNILSKKSASTQALVQKVKKYKHGKNIVFELKISPTTTLIGYDLSKRTKRFVNKIGRRNGAILPWTIVIEDGEAKTLDAKYYIAISYPLLDMSGFMGIATVPGAIKKELEKPFR